MEHVAAGHIKTERAAVEHVAAGHIKTERAAVEHVAAGYVKAGRPVEAKKLFTFCGASCIVGSVEKCEFCSTDLVESTALRSGMQRSNSGVCAFEFSSRVGGGYDRCFFVGNGAFTDKSAGIRIFIGWKTLPWERRTRDREDKERGSKNEPMGFAADAPEYYSDNGVRVRSKSEIIIANMLENTGVPYKYECPIDLAAKGTVRPDFTCLNVRTRKEYIWEHFGMMDDEEYANKNVQKINAYEEKSYICGVNLIMTFETSRVPVNTNVVREMIERFLL